MPKDNEKRRKEIMTSFKKSPNTNDKSLFNSEIGLDIVKDALTMLLEDRVVAYRPMLARIFGGPGAAVFLSQLLHWTGKETGKEGWIWKNQKEWEEETGMNVNVQRTARRQLKKHGVLLEKKDRIKHETYYKLDRDIFISKIREYFAPKQEKEVRGSISLLPEIGNSGVAVHENPISILRPEITSEITSEITKRAAPKGSAPVQALAAQWCEFARIEVEDLTGKDLKALGDHVRKRADIDQLKALSKAAWEEKNMDLAYLYSNRASLLPKIKPKDGTGYQPIDLTGPVMSKEELDSVMGENRREPKEGNNSA